MTLPLMAPWAEEDRNGYLTGRLAFEPPRAADGTIPPGWRYIGKVTQANFAAAYIRERHEGYHTAQRADWRCRHCREAGWVK